MNFLEQCNIKYGEQWKGNTFKHGNNVNERTE